MPLDPLSKAAAAADQVDGRVLRITNLRVDASGSPSGTTPVYGIVTAAPFAIANATVVNGYVQPGLTFSLRSPDDSAPSNGLTLDQCSASIPQRAGVLRFTENFGTTFKTRSMTPFVDAQTSPVPQPQDIPGAIYIGETGFYAPDLTSPVVDFATVGLATAGTRVRAQLSNIPLGARVFVSQQRVEFTGSTPSVPATGAVARLVVDETLAFTPAPVTSTIEGIAATELTVTNGTASAVWEVLRTNPNTVESLDFVFWVQGGATSIAAASVTGSLAPAPPAFADAGSHQPSSTLPVPRFQAGATAQPAFSVTNCAPHFTRAATLPDGTKWAPYTLTFGAAGGAPPYLFWVSSGTPPPGVHITVGQQGISGIPQSSGDYSFSVSVSDSLQNQATSVFSLHVNAGSDPGPPTADSVSPASGSGSTAALTFNYTDSRGVDDMAQFGLWFATSPTATAANSCWVSFDPTWVGGLRYPRLRLLDDSGQNLIIDVLGLKVLQNSQCLVELLGGGTDLIHWSVDLKIHFFPGFAGTKNVYLSTNSKLGEATGNVQRGTWTATVPAVVTGPLTPSSASGNSQVFAAQFTDANGLSDVSLISLWLATGPYPIGGNTCRVGYSPQTGHYQLAADDTSTIDIPPNSGLYQNSQCIVDSSRLAVSAAGNTYTFSVPLRFKGVSPTNWNVFLNAQSATTDSYFYGKAMTDTKRQAHTKVVELVLRKSVKSEENVGQTKPKAVIGS